MLHVYHERLFSGVKYPPQIVPTTIAWCPPWNSSLLWNYGCYLVQTSLLTCDQKLLNRVAEPFFIRKVKVWGTVNWTENPNL
jgi:hypothetical protein